MRRLKTSPCHGWLKLNLCLRQLAEISNELRKRNLTLGFGFSGGPHAVRARLRRREKRSHESLGFAEARGWAASAFTRNVGGGLTSIAAANGSRDR